MPYESDVMLSVNVHSEKERKEVWRRLYDLGVDISADFPTATVMLTANDEEEVVKSERRVVDAIMDKQIEETEKLEKINEIVRKALLDQDSATYHEESGDIYDRADRAVKKIFDALK